MSAQLIMHSLTKVRVWRSLSESVALRSEMNHELY